MMTLPIFLEQSISHSSFQNPQLENEQKSYSKNHQADISSIIKSHETTISLWFSCGFNGDGHRGAHIGHWGAECHLLGEGVKLGSITPMGCMDQYLWAFLYTYNMYIDINKICMYVNIYVYIFGVIYI